MGLPPTDPLQHVLAGLIVLVIGSGLFAWGKLGGGDVKLLTATSLWVGWGPTLLDLFLAIGVLGAAISLIVIAFTEPHRGGSLPWQGIPPCRSRSESWCPLPPCSCGRPLPRLACARLQRRHWTAP